LHHGAVTLTKDNQNILYMYQQPQRKFTAVNACNLHTCDSWRIKLNNGFIFV